MNHTGILVAVCYCLLESVSSSPLPYQLLTCLEDFGDVVPSIFMDVYRPGLHVMLDVLEPAFGLFQWQVLHQSLVDIIFRIAQQASSLQEDTPTCNLRWTSAAILASREKNKCHKCLDVWLKRWNGETMEQEEKQLSPKQHGPWFSNVHCCLGHLSFRYRAGICSPSCQRLAYHPQIGTHLGLGVGVLLEFIDFLQQCVQTSNLASKFVKKISLRIKMISLKNGQLVWARPSTN